VTDTWEVLRRAQLVGVECGRTQDSVVELLGIPDTDGVAQGFDDMAWGDLTVVFHDGKVLYSQVNFHDLTPLELPAALPDAKSLQGLPRHLAELVEKLEANAIDHVAAELYRTASTIEIATPSGTAVMQFHETSLVELLFSWPKGQRG